MRLPKARRKVLYAGPRHYHRPNYVEALAALSPLVRPGDVRHVQVVHEDDCAHWNGRGCDCNPEIRLLGGEPRA